jgi:hypothetical protein
MDDLGKWYENLTYKDADAILGDCMANIKRSFVATGYYLRYIRDHELYREGGYGNLWDYAQDRFGITRTTAARWMEINSRFSKDGNSPVLADEYGKYGKSQLQEMLYLEDEQLENVTPDMTVKEIRAVREPDPEPEEELVSILGYPLREYPEGSMIATKGCGNQDCSSCHRDGCGLRQEECTCVEATVAKPFPCNTLKMMEEGLRKEVGDKCQFVNEDLAYHRTGDGQPVPCCKECNDPCRYECGRARVARYRKMAVCDVAQKTLEENNNIDSANNNVVTDQPESATESVENETEKDIIDTECRGIATKSGGKEPASILTYLVEACIDHFKFADLYEESEDTDEFYDKLYDSMFGQFIQFYYDGDEFRAEFSGNIHITSTGLKKVRRESYRWWQFLKEFEHIGDIGEKYAAENAEICDQEDSGSEEPQFNETAVKDYLWEERRALDEYEAVNKTEGLPGLVMIRKRMIVEALELLLKKMTDPDNDPEEAVAEREQPELPILRNNEQRKAFLAEYKTWPIWFEVPQAAETYYRYNLPDGSSIVVCEYHEWLAWAEKHPSAYPEGPDRIYKSYYLLKPGYHYLHDCSASETELINHLKDVQKNMTKR